MIGQFDLKLHQFCKSDEHFGTSQQRKHDTGIGEGENFVNA